MAKYKNFAELKINDFRAIKSADINLNGITVVAGINGCGKTTMSKMVYNIYKGVTEFDGESYINFNMPNILKQVKDQLIFDYSLFINDDLFCESNDGVFYSKLNEFYRYFIKDSNPKSLRILQETLESDSENFLELFGSFCSLYREAYLKFKGKVDNRDYSIMKWELNRNYLKDTITDKIVFSEYGGNIVGPDVDRIPLPYAVRKVFYIESPYTIDKDLEYSLKNKKYNDDADVVTIDQINDFLKGQSILNGSSSYDKMRDRFFYTSNDISIELSDAATGIRSFSTIQMLLKNGWLGPRTLLIIDEPEAHLHPQWIVEYAKLIVMLHKELGVKFFIASHNPDMVRALRYIAEKDGVLESLNFYLGDKENDTDLQYTFKDCGNDIEPVFDSFNKSFAKFDEYVYPEIFQ